MKSEIVNSMVDQLVRCADIKKDTLIYTFFSDGIGIDVTYGKLHQQARNAAGYLQVRYDRGERVILALKPGENFITSFFGCLYAGIIPIPLYPPFTQAFINKIDHVIHDAGPIAIITSFDLAEAGRSLGWNYGALDLVFNEEFTSEWGEAWVQGRISGDDIAFLQYTSGSTNHPKGVIVTHANILENEGLIQSGFSQDTNTIGVGWLPVYHDMGLIGNVLQPCYTGYRMVLISPLDFMADPLCWLEMISRYKATISGGPNFAFDLCVRRYDEKRCENIDLSSWDLAFTGAEPVRGDTIRRFAKCYKSHGFSRNAFLPCYGLAENTLLACCTAKTDRVKEIHVMKAAFKKGIIEISKTTSDKTLGLVSNGVCPPGQSLCIVDHTNFEILPEGQVGEIWLQGKSAARGYWNNDELTRETFQAYTASGKGPFLRTGDLGFLSHGELYIAGRIKDLIIIRGRNYYPQDIELSVEKALKSIRPGRVVAFLSNEKLCVLAEYVGTLEQSQTVLKTIVKQVKKDYELNVDYVLLVSPKSLPVTTSGKIRRNDSRKSFENDSLSVIERYCADDDREFVEPVGPMPLDNTRETFLLIFSQYLGLEPHDIDPDLPFGHYGLTSSEAVELTEKLSTITSQPCTPTLFYDYPTINRLFDYVSGKSKPDLGIRAQALKTTGMATGDMAIVGMACRFPGATDIDAFWNNIENSYDCLSDFPKDARAPFLNRAKGGFSRRGGFIEDIDAFDAHYFSISPKEAKLMDPQQRIFLETVWHCLAHAGYAPGTLGGKDLGVFAGVSSFDYSDVLRESGIQPEAYTATGMAHTMIANRVSFLLNVHGPSEIIDTACSSSLVAIHRAVSAIRQGDCSMALAGGVNILISPDTFTSLGRSGFLSSRGQCSTFDSMADGYVRGEGCGVVLLKRLDHARRDGDFIHAVIRGTSVSHGGMSESLTAPNALSQAQLIIKTCVDAKVSPETISYMETHGTGTILGDPIEVNGLLTAFREMYKTGDGDFDKTSCALGSVKSIIGHLESAAGIAGVIKVVEALKRKVIPPNRHVDTLNPLIQLEGSPFYVPGETMAWHGNRDRDRDGKEMPCRAGISSFGFGGTYAHMILESHENHFSESHDEDYLFVFSSRTREGLDALVDRFLVWIGETKNYLMVKNHFYDAACTLWEGRDHLDARLAMVVRDADGLIKTMKTFRQTGESGSDAWFGLCKKNEPRQRCFEQNPKDAARRWAMGDDLDWDGLRKGQGFKKIPLPGYVFEKQRYFAMESHEHITESETDRVSQNPLTYREPKGCSLEDMVLFLSHEVSQMVNVSERQVDPNTQFNDYGMDSMAVISLVHSLEQYAGIEMPPSSIQDYTTILSLARFVAGGMVEEYQEPYLLGDTELDEFLFNRSTPMVRTQGKAIFLTGSTGYLGSYLLVELLEKTDAQIYCLVRAENETKGRERVRLAALNFGSGRNLPHERIHIITGDLGELRLGLGIKEFNKLSNTIDTIWHCGATVDWLKPYAALKNTNVNGTREVIRMAAHKSIKTLHFISSLAVLPLVEGQNEWFEKEVRDPSGIRAGYGQSKWVAEQLCLKAAKLGVPVSIYRFDYVAGKPGSGVMKQSDFIARLIKGCIQMGCMPLEETNFDIIPVDYLCRMMLSIAHGDKPSGKIYHLLNRRPFSTSDFASLIRKRGHKIHRIPFEDWKKLCQKDPRNVLYPLYPFISRYDTNAFEAYASWKVDNTQAMTALFLSDKELIQHIPSAADVLESVMDYLTQSDSIPRGVFAEMFDCHRTYWENQLKDAPVHSSVPFQGRFRDHYDKALGECAFIFDNATHTVMEETARDKDLDAMTLVLAQVFVLLSRYSRQEDLLLSLWNTNDRTLRGPCFIRSLCSSKTALGGHAHQVSHLLDQARAHRDMPRDILEKLMGIDPLGSYPIQVVWGDMAGKDMRLSGSPLSFKFFNAPQGLSGRIVYDRSLYDSNYIQNMARHLENLVFGMKEGWDKAISRLTMMDSKECEELIVGMNRTEMDYPLGKCVHQLFAEQAKKQPRALAVLCEEDRLSYGELNSRSDMLSVYLHDRGVGKGHVVGLCVERSITMMVSIMGILKSGAAYLPLDPDYPGERLAHMISDTGARLILCSRSLKHHIPPNEGELIVLEDEDERIRAMGKKKNYARCLETMDRAADSKDLAYIIYTSGSTGKPKGVRAMHQGLVNLVYGMNQLIDFTPEDTMLGITRLSFDMVKPELYLPLLTGGKIHIISQTLARDGYLLRDFLEKNPVSLMQATPSSWRLLVYAGWRGNPDMTLITGGEDLPQDLADILSGKGKQLLNLYGPTETTVWSTAAHIKTGTGVNIGYPLANTRLYILDPDMNSVPKGVPGELYIGGHGVTQGYHLQPDLTWERYIANPFVSLPEMIYRTGDLVRMLPDGALEYIERLDCQVKIRGYRIELKEIERALTDIPGVKEAVVLVRDDAPSGKILESWLVPEPSGKHPDEGSLRETLKGRLPSWMVPVHFVWIDRMPLNKNGKIDAKQLPDWVHDENPQNRIPPVREMEKLLLPMWIEVLRISNLGITDDFVDCGGDSLKAMNLLVNINERLGIELTVQKLFENLTVQKLAQTVERIMRGEEIYTNEAALKMQEDAILDTGFIQNRLEVIQPDGDFMNIFLTGATGYLGAYLLKDLMEYTQSVVFCLVRSKNREDGLNRLKSNLEKFSVWKDEYTDRIIPLSGDLAHERFGLLDETYHSVACLVDAVIHNGAMVNFSYPYDLLRKANVTGTLEVLKFTACERIKPLYFISTIGVFESKIPFTQGKVGDDHVLPDADQLYYGYAQSKWVAEKLVTQYRDKGMPVTIFRPGPIYGNSITGELNTDDFFCRMIRACVLIGAMPQLDIEMDGVAVDQVSRAIIEIASNPASVGKQFNIVNPRATTVEKVNSYVRSYGYDMPMVPVGTWMEMIKKEAGQDSELLPFLPLVFDRMEGAQGRTFFEMQTLNRQTYSSATLMEFLKGSDFEPIALDEQMFHTYLDYLNRVGYLSHVPEYQDI
ncbi:MAG: thioester reductase domain-containing protein [Proteobacteria bacterium]|nr:thioester reductase domain-containing protein [Pseudomonadota bacterium]